MAEQRIKSVSLSAEEARQGEILLRRRWQRAAFVAGLIGMVVLAGILKFTVW